MGFSLIEHSLATVELLIFRTQKKLTRHVLCRYDEALQDLLRPGKAVEKNESPIRPKRTSTLEGTTRPLSFSNYSRLIKTPALWYVRVPSRHVWPS